ncbi:methyltransferase domain-containing protein [Hoeflea sp. TYP-13]|uniref:class I SAM-dependent methyltransferase n=1 Tax=Hoeflea sp. TYP-13 TaxID=3230023 RepID=UPI0034C6AA7B
MLILDLGCGQKKIEGAVGIDFSSMSDADLILNLNEEYLPYEDSSVDLIYSSHTLEHLSIDGFFHVMKEAYRVLKPGGQSNIVVPYFMTTANFANPFHNNNICFNEHTFRFFSSETICNATDKDDYATPSCPQWGLRYSANAELGIEFRTLDIFYYYFPEYQDLSEKEKRIARSSKLNVVDQISYVLEAVKPCPIRPETAPVANSDDPRELAEDQLHYLRRQVDFLEGKESHKMTSRAREYLAGSFEKSGLYNRRGLLSPVNQLALELDYMIQTLRRYIGE